MLGRSPDKTALEMSQLPIHSTGTACISCWALSAQELEIVKKTGRVWVWVHSAGTQPGINVEANNPFGDGGGDRVLRAVDLLCAERERHIDKHPAEDDDRISFVELAIAGACYLLGCAVAGSPVASAAKALWPWGIEKFRVKSGLRNLMRGGAMVLAALDRFHREDPERFTAELLEYETCEKERLLAIQRRQREQANGV